MYYGEARQQHSVRRGFRFTGRGGRGFRVAKAMIRTGPLNALNSQAAMRSRHHAPC